MKIVDKIFIKRPAATVWAFLEDPENMPAWNPNVQRVSAPRLSKPKLGYRYAISYRLGSKAPENFQAEFVVYAPPSKLVIRHSQGSARVSERIIEESYELTERDGGCLLRQTILVKNSGINIFIRLLVWLIQTFGKPSGKTYLEDLRDIVEGEA